ncbi:hypothetical protein EGC79_20515, partial [Shewanella vesiculosa]|uniref:portal protein n=1 Tax=Shewanella vesiculosa TaxID=518738 RepID=UPI000FA8BCDA
CFFCLFFGCFVQSLIIVRVLMYVPYVFFSVTSVPLCHQPESRRERQWCISSSPKALEVLAQSLDRWERRISRGFLMGSAIIRDAERVTQEEVRMTANELETAYGGVYSTLPASLQNPVGVWLLDASDFSLQGTQIEVTIVTGLDALSRNGDLENFRLAISDLAQIATLPETLQARMKFDEIKAFVGQGRNVDLDKFLMTDAEYAKVQEQQQASRMAETVGTEAGIAATQGQA